MTYFRATNDSGSRLELSSWKSWLAGDVQASLPSAGSSKVSCGSSNGGQLKSYVDATADLPWYSSPQLLCKGSLCLLWSSLQKIRFHHVWTPDLPLTSLRQLVPKLWECLVDMILAFLTAWPLWRLYPAVAKSHEIDRSLSVALLPLMLDMKKTLLRWVLLILSNMMSHHQCLLQKNVFVRHNPSALTTDKRISANNRPKHIR